MLFCSCVNNSLQCSSGETCFWLTYSYIRVWLLNEKSSSYPTGFHETKDWSSVLLLCTVRKIVLKIDGVYSSSIDLFACKQVVVSLWVYFSVNDCTSMANRVLLVLRPDFNLSSDNQNWVVFSEKGWWGRTLSLPLLAAAVHWIGKTGLTKINKTQIIIKKY